MMYCLGCFSSSRIPQEKIHLIVEMSHKTKLILLFINKHFGEAPIDNILYSINLFMYINVTYYQFK